MPSFFFQSTAQYDGYIGDDATPDRQRRGCAKMEIPRGDAAAETGPDQLTTRTRGASAVACSW